MASEEREWEIVSDEDDQTDQLRVPGSWLYCRQTGGNAGNAVAMAFVPNPPKLHVVAAPGRRRELAGRTLIMSRKPLRLARSQGSPAEA